jgi:hypothetical protein
MHTGRSWAYGVAGALFYTFEAGDAFLAGVHLFFRWADAFGVVTPDARQGASFEKDGDAQAGAVVDGKAFDVEE